MDKNPSDVEELKKKLDRLMEKALEAASQNRDFDLERYGGELGLDEKALHSARKVLDRLQLEQE